MNEQPILAGYSYQPGHTTATPPPPEATRPLTPLATTPDSITNYKTKSNTGWIIAIVAVLILAVVGGIIINNLPAPGTDPTDQATSEAPGTPGRSGGTAFADEDLSGYWTLLDTQWTSTGVKVTIEITVDTGTLYYDFYGYANTDRTQHWPVWTSDTDLEPGFLGPGESITGTLVFELSKQPTTLVMISRHQYQLSALTIPL